MKILVVIKKISTWTKNKRKTFTWSDWFFVAIIIFTIATRLPLFIEQFNKQGKIFSPIEVNGKSFPPMGEKSVLVFWASWCGPCTLELNRINSAIDKKEFSPANIYAVNMGESKEVVDREIRKRKYNFAIVSDDRNELANSLNVKVTPTIAFISKSGKIEWLSSGISPLLIYRIQSFFKD